MKKIVIITLACIIALSVCIVVYEGLQIDALTKMIDELQVPKLDVVKVDFESSETEFYVSGVMYNLGVQTARNVTLTIEAYAKNGTLLESEALKLGDIPGREHVAYSYSCRCPEVYMIGQNVSFA